MTDSFPPPRFSEDWWREHATKNPVTGPPELYQPDVLTEQTWLVWTEVPQRDAGPASGNDQPVSLPTGTDLLLLLRHGPLFMGALDPKVGDVCAGVIDLIDRAPPNTNAIGILRDQRDVLVREFPDVAVRGYESIHTWLSEQGTEAEIRERLNSDQVVNLHGYRSMPAWAWQRVLSVS